MPMHPHLVIAATSLFVTGILDGHAASTSQAQVYPSRSIRMIVPAAAGGGPDVNGRLMATELSKQVAQPIVVDNRPGASAIVGFETLARATPDGYTFGLMTSPFTTNPSLHAKLPYDSVRDFQPVITMGSVTFLLAVTPALPIQSVKSLLAHALANPGTLSYGSTGVGSGHHLVMELLKFQTGANVVHVSYKAIQQAITDVMGGQIHLICENTAVLIPYARSGRLRGLGVTTLKRSSAIPELPTLDEAGIPGYEASILSGFAMPAGVPREIVTRLNAEINKALQSPTLIEKYAANGLVTDGGSPAKYAESLRAETAKWAKVIKAAGIKPQ